MRYAVQMITKYPHRIKTGDGIQETIRQEYNVIPAQSWKDAQRIHETMAKELCRGSLYDRSFCVVCYVYAADARKGHWLIAEDILRLADEIITDEKTELA